MKQADRVVERILEHLEARIDLEHVAQARARQRAALDYAEVDRPPLVIYLPYEGQDLRPYPYPEAFADPAKMMVNELLIGFTSLYHAVDLRDDAPYCLRPNLGTGLIASMFGAEIRLVDDNMPWVMPLGSMQRLRAVAEGPLPEVTSGLGQRMLDQYEYYSQVLASYPRCRAALQLTLPDLQGPFSTAELLWGSEIYPAFYEQPDLIRQLLAKITAQMLAVFRALAGKTRDLLGQGYCHQHGAAVRGNLLIRNDSMINLSPRLYREAVLPFDAQLAEALGGVGVHFCGNGMHQVSNLLGMPGMHCLDLGNPEMLDLDALYAQATPRRVALARLQVPEAELRAAALKQRFPRGVTLVHVASSVAAAQRLWQRYVASEGQP
jgi:hypothetical protein